MYDQNFGALGGYNPTFAASPTINQFQQLAKTFGSSMKQAFPQPPTPKAGPAMPNDGAMQPTIGPGTASGGLPGIPQGGSPGIMGLLQRLIQPQAAPLAGGMPAAGMLSGLPGTPGASAAGPVAPPSPQLPMNINPTEQF